MNKSIWVVIFIFSITSLPAYMTVNFENIPSIAKTLMIMFSIVCGFVLGGISGLIENDDRKSKENDHESR